jgi:hypothetical protein
MLLTSATVGQVWPEISMTMQRAIRRHRLRHSRRRCSPMSSATFAKSFHSPRMAWPSSSRVGSSTLGSMPVLVLRALARQRYYRRFQVGHPVRQCLVHR